MCLSCRRLECGARRRAAESFPPVRARAGGAPAAGPLPGGCFSRARPSWNRYNRGLSGPQAGGGPMPSADSFRAFLTRLQAKDEQAAAELFHRFAFRLIGLARVRLDEKLRAVTDPED